MRNFRPMPSYTDNQTEYVDTYTADGTRLSPQQRGYVHRNGIWHRAVNVMIYTSKGDLLLQQRAESKRVCPLAWDLSVAEHLHVGEDWQSAAHRGLAEELGLRDVTLTECGPEIQERHDVPAHGISDCEFQRCFRGTTDSTPLLDPAEVAAIRQLSVEQFNTEVQNAPESFTPWLLRWSRTLEIIPQ